MEAEIGIVQCEKDLIDHSGFEYGRGPQGKECWQPPEVGRCKKMDPLLGPPKRNAALILPSEIYPFQISDLQIYERTNVCCFKPLSLWQFVTATVRNEYTSHTWEWG